MEVTESSGFWFPTFATEGRSYIRIYELSGNVLRLLLHIKQNHFERYTLGNSVFAKPITNKHKLLLINGSPLSPARADPDYYF